MLTNFAWVVEGVLARSGRPQPADYASISNVYLWTVSLEGQDEDDKEAAGLKPMTVISRPISAWDIYVDGVSQNYLNSILSHLPTDVTRLSKPVLVHCQHGEDRTGLVIAAYRVRSGWTKEAAWAEAKKMGYRSWPLNIGLTKTWNAFQS